MPLGKKIALVAAALLVSLAAASAFHQDVPPVSDQGNAATADSPQFVEPVTRRLTADSAMRPPRAHTPFHLAPNRTTPSRRPRQPRVRARENWPAYR